MAARLERALEKQLGQKPSANLIRAMLANSAKCSAEMEAWGMDSTDAYYTGKDNPKRERLMRLYGYGKISDQLLASTDNSVTLFAEDKLPLRDFHLYKIPVPQKFAKIKVDKSITVSLAYDPVTRMSRKEYLANNLWIEIFRRIDEESLIKYKAKKRPVSTQKKISRIFQVNIKQIFIQDMMLFKNLHYSKDVGTNQRKVALIFCGKIMITHIYIF